MRKGVRVGAHPGFPDRESMGRRIPSAEEIVGYADSLLRQPSQVPHYAYIKPHGAFYNLLVGSDSPEQREALKIAFTYACEWHAVLMLLSDEAVSRVANSHSPQLLTIIKEGFADRAYQSDGTLLSRSQPGAILHDPDQIKRQVLNLAPKVDSICLHGDTPDCLEFAELIYRTLVDHGYEVGS